MRLFVAIEVPDPWRAAAREAQIQLELALERLLGVGGASRLRAVDPALMHVTLRFLGEVVEERVEPLAAALRAGVPPVDVDLALAGAGTFGPPRRTAVAWLGIAGDLDGLRAVAARVEDAADAAGLGREERPLSPHLTLARVHRAASPAERAAIARAVEALPPPPQARFRARSVALVRSHLGGPQPRYEVLARAE